MSIGGTSVASFDVIVRWVLHSGSSFFKVTYGEHLPEREGFPLFFDEDDEDDDDNNNDDDDDDDGGGGGIDAGSGNSGGDGSSGDGNGNGGRVVAYSFFVELPVHCTREELLYIGKKKYTISTLVLLVCCVILRCCYCASDFADTGKRYSQKP
ncbi:hypothetical protein V1477_012467 [Vespula maculifrons]|uniref:Uncharacterized protein n=1 Tax=Vespula maculifrons TaxID=7453 RepID=A0ABD2BXJ1_VESMC